MRSRSPAAARPRSAAPIASCGVGSAQDAEVTLRYQNHWSKETDAHYEGMNWLYEAFHAAHPNIKIENILNPDSEESDKKILADCAAGDCPDIIHDANATSGPRATCST